MNSQNFITEIYSITRVDITQKGRRRELVELRCLYFQLCREFCPNMSLKKIGESVNQDHASVIHSLKNYDFHMNNNPKLDDYRNRILGEDYITQEDKELTLYDPKEEPYMDVINKLINVLHKSHIQDVLIERLEAFCKMNKPR